MMNKLVGRTQQQEILLEALHSDEAEMVSVVGRRRVGKTFLVNTTYENHLAFSITGIKNAPLHQQLQHFRNEFMEFSKISIPIEPPKDWIGAFYMLRVFLKSSLEKDKAKRVIFFDELPWLASRKSGFLDAFAYFWNSWASKQNIVVVICGSAASWMIRKITKDKGGLHNRITKRIKLHPFTLSETKQFFQKKNIKLDPYQILQVYMAMGGIPHYLKEIKKGKSAAQNIDAICFSETGLLKEEFEELYPALFENPERHIAVVRTLATKWRGLTRTEIIKSIDTNSGSGLTKTLNDLTQSGFISAYYPFGKKRKNLLYRLTDEYSLFYLQFMENKVHEGIGTWKHLSQTPTYKSWSGYAYESICIKHLPQIKKALSIDGVYALASGFVKKGTKKEKGTQIDLVLDRNDHVINLFEIKFYNDKWTFTKAMADNLQQKTEVFRKSTNTSKQIFWVLITTFDLEPNEFSLALVDEVLGMEVLFK